MSIRVFAGGRVEIVVPRWVRASAIQRFVSEHRTWTERKVAELSSRQPAVQRHLPERIEFPATGETFTVTYGGGEGRVRLQVAGPGELRILGHVPADAAREKQVRRCLQKWLIDQARRALEPWLRSLSAQTGLGYRSCQVRRQRTRWGSCSFRGTVSLNCCLLFQRPDVVSYLLVHELSHTRHMNHSQRFWHLVASHVPDYRNLDRQLVQGWQNVPHWVFEP